MSSQLVELDWGDRRVAIEYRSIAAAHPDAPLIVFLHEGLGSVAMWKDFPDRLCERSGCRGLVYSRPGYGASTPRAVTEFWRPDFMHRQATQLLPALLARLGHSAQPLWLFGHSDGGSIALIAAARRSVPVVGLIVLAPHIMVEALSVDSIAKARDTYLATDLRARLARYHADPDSAFWGWNDIWLAAEFRDWSIEGELASIDCPVLAIQGVDDEYGTLEQIQGIARRTPRAQAIELAECGHSPHRDQPERVIIAVTGFIQQHHPGDNR